MLVALRKASWEPPSRPAIEPESTVVLPARPRNRLLMIFLQEARPEKELQHRVTEAALPLPQLLRYPTYTHNMAAARSLGQYVPYPIVRLEEEKTQDRQEGMQAGSGQWRQSAPLPHRWGQRVIVTHSLAHYLINLCISSLVHYLFHRAGMCAVLTANCLAPTGPSLLVSKYL